MVPVTYREEMHSHRLSTVGDQETVGGDQSTHNTLHTIHVPVAMIAGNWK